MLMRKLKKIDKRAKLLLCYSAKCSVKTFLRESFNES